MKLMEKIGTNVKKLRTIKDYSQHELSRQSGVSLSIINWAENNKLNNISVKTLERLAYSLGVTAVKLME